MKLRCLKTAQFIFAGLILCAPVLKTLTRTGAQISIWFYVFEFACIGGLLVCRWLFRCPHCKNRLNINLPQQCPHCKENLDV